jgi:putative transposase
MKVVFIEKHQAEFSIKAMCRVLRVAHSSWYAWRCHRHQGSSRQRFRLVCDDIVSKAFNNAKQRYGAPRLADE